MLAALGVSTAAACTTENIYHAPEKDDGAIDGGVGGAGGVKARAPHDKLLIPYPEPDGSGGSPGSAMTTTTTTTSTGSGMPMPCAQQATFEACAACYCDDNVQLCEAYISVMVQTLYCGNSCSGDCADFCAGVAAGVSPGCNYCVDYNLSSQDIDAWVAQCQNDMSCAWFAQLLSTCP
jgi:hypothetical protein